MAFSRKGHANHLPGRTKSERNSVVNSMNRMPWNPSQVERFRRDGYIKLKHVLSPEVLDYYGREITRQVILLNEQSKPMSERTTYEKAFLQIMNL